MTPLRAALGLAAWILAAGSAAAGPGTWTSSGPPDLPRISQVAPHPTDPLRAACVRWPRGVLVTEDGGRTWLPRSRGVDPFDSITVAWDRLVPERLWRAGTDLHRSEDGGLTWVQVGLGVDWRRSVAVLPDPLVRDTLILVGESGAWESTDAGETFTPLGTGWPGGRPEAAVRAPSDPGVIYVSFQGRGSGVWRFDRSTRAWTSMSAGLDTCILGRIAVASRSADIAWLVASCSGQGSRLLLTTDGGGSWAPVSAIPYTSALAVDLTRDFTIWRAGWKSDGSQDIFRSDDAGQTWTGVGSGLGSAGLTDIAISPVTPLVMLASTDIGGVHCSVDGGLTWSESGRGLDGAMILALEMDGMNPSTLLATNFVIDMPAGPALGPLYRSSDAGASWSTLPGTPLPPGGGSVGQLASRPGASGRFFAAAGSSAPALSRTDDSGDSWQPAAAGLPTSFSAGHIVADPFVPGRVFTVDWGGGTPNSSGDAYRSLDDADTWTPIWSRATGVEILRIEIDVQQPGRLVATALHVASGTWMTLVSRDAGSTWASGPVLPAPISQVVAVAGATWHAMKWEPPGIWRFDEATAAWTAIDAGLPLASSGAAIAEVEMEGADPSALVVGILGGGLWRTADGGATWCPLNQDAMDHAAYAGGVEIDPGPPKTFHRATTAGVWSLTLDPSTLLLTLTKSAADVLLSWSPSATPVTLRRGATPSGLRVLVGCATPVHPDPVLNDRRLWYYDASW